MSHRPQVPSQHPKKEKFSNLNEGFSKWAFAQIPFIITQIIAVLLAFCSFLYYVHDGGKVLTEIIDIDQTDNLLFVANIIFCGFCIVKLMMIMNDNEDGEYRSQKVYNRIYNTIISQKEHVVLLFRAKGALYTFKKYFIWFWIITGFLYVFFLITPPGKPIYKPLQERYTVVSYFDPTPVSEEKKECKKCDKVMPVYAVKIDTDTVFEQPTPVIYSSRPDSPRIDTMKRDPAITDRLAAFKDRGFSMAQYTFNNLESMFIFWCFAILGMSTRHRFSYKNQRLISLSIFIIVLLEVSFPLFLGLAANCHGIYTRNRLISYTVLFDAISGVVNALAVALLIARLDSKLIGLRSSLISVLYVYAAVQPLFVVFELPEYINEVIKASVLLLVFLLKIYFFFIITYAIETGRLLNYLYCYTTLDERVDSVLQNNYKIQMAEHEGEYKFDIYDEEVHIFKGELEVDSKEKCLEMIE